MRQAYAGQYGYGPYNAPTGSTADGDRLTNLKRAIDSIEQRLGGQAMHTTPPYADPMMSRAGVSDLGLMQEQINRLSSQLGMNQPRFAQPVPDLNAAASEIAQRQQMLSQSVPGSGYPKHAVPPRPASNGSIEAIGSHLAALRKEISGLKDEVAKPISVQPKVPQSDIDRIAGAIAEMQRGERIDQTAFHELQNDLESLRATFRNDLQDTLKNELSQAQAAQASHTEQLMSSVAADAKVREQAEIAREIADDERRSEINQRLDALTQGLDSIARTIPQVASAPVDAFAAQFDSLQQSLNALPQTLAANGVEQHIHELNSKLDELTAFQSAAAAAQQSDQAGAVSAEHLGALESRLDEIARALVAVSNTSPAAADLSSIDRLEARMKDLGRSVHAMAEAHSAMQQATNQALSGATERDKAELKHLATRIEGLTERLGSFEKYAQSGDLAGASAMLANPDVGALEGQLRQLSSQVDNINIASHLGPLEFQLRELAARVEENAHANASGEQLAGLEAQISQIMDHINQPHGAGQFDVGAILTPLEDRFGQLESQIASGQQYSMEAAQQAAQQAVSMIGTQSEPGELIAALSEDLRSLQLAAESGNAQNAETVQEVHETLTQIVDRLVAIEENVAKGGFESPLTEPAPASAVRVATVVTEEEIVAPEPETPVAPAAQTMPPEATAPEAPVKLSDELPAAEGVPEPMVHATPRPAADSDFDQLTRRAATRLSEATGAAPNSMLSGSRPPEDMPLNPVEKARRALQATTAEMNAVRDQVKTTKPSGLSEKVAGLKSKSFDLSILRKPIAMAAAAVLLLAGIGGAGYYAFDRILGDVPAKVASAPAPKTTATPPTSGTTKTKQLPAKADKRVARQVAPSTERVVKDDAQIVVSPSASQQPKPEVVPEPVAPEDTVAVANPQSTQPQPTTPVNVQPEPVTDGPAANEAETGSDAQALAPTFDVPTTAGTPELVAAAATGDPKALYQIGMRYSDGRETQRNMKESAKWFEKAAESGFAPAQYSIGSLYEKGIGVESDVRTAASWYEKAAAQGNARAMHNLAVIRAMGNPPTVQPDMEAALSWFKQAAEFGVKDSQFNLGILYGRGMGVPQNLAESYKWFAVAAKTGDKDAASKRDEVAAKMEPADLKAAQDRLNAWSAKPMDEANNRVSIPENWRGKPAASLDDNSPQGMLKKAQALLNQRGFSVGTPDGLMGPKTKRAIMKFQQNAGIPVTGKVDKRLLQALDIQT